MKIIISLLVFIFLTSCLQPNEELKELIKENVEVTKEIEPEDLPPEVLKDLLPSVTIFGPEITNYSILDEVPVLNFKFKFANYEDIKDYENLVEFISDGDLVFEPIYTLDENILNIRLKYLSGELGTLKLKIEKDKLENKYGKNEDDFTSKVYDFSLGSGYDVILIAGQSNTIAGIGIDAIKDQPHPKVFQLGRYENDFNIIEAKEPLASHHKSLPNRIGFALSFAKLLVDDLQTDRKILLIHCGKGGSTFIHNAWNPGDKLYEDAVSRTNYILDNFDRSRLVSILWHQGESDRNNLNYQNQLDTMIKKIRLDIVNYQNVPFILGGLPPKRMLEDPVMEVNHNIIKDTPNRITYTAFADSQGLKSNTHESIHFSADAQRELGERYYLQYLKLKKNMNE